MSQRPTMSPRKIATILATFAAIAALIVTVRIAHQEKVAHAELVKRVNDLCKRVQWDLESLSRTQNVTSLHDRMQEHFLDQGISKLCLGEEVPVDASAASWCWVTKGSDECYRDVLRALVERYAARPDSH